MKRHLDTKTMTSLALAIATIGAAPAGLTAATISSLTDDFTADTIDASKWNTNPVNFPGEAGTGTLTVDTTTNADQVTFSGSSTTDFWGGTQLESVDSFSSGLATTIQVDRVSIAGSGSGLRSGLSLIHPTAGVVLFAQNTELGGNNWTYNSNGLTGGGINAGVDAAGTDLGLHNMRFEFTPLGGTDATVQMFLDNTAGVTLNFNNWDNSQDFRMAFAGFPRASTDTITGIVYDNFSAVAIPEPSGALLAGLGAAGLLVRRRRQK